MIQAAFRRLVLLFVLVGAPIIGTPRSSAARVSAQASGPAAVFPGVTVTKVAAIGSGFNRMVLNPADGNIYYMDFSLNIWRLNRPGFTSSKVVDFFSPGLPTLIDGFYSSGLAFDNNGVMYVLGNGNGGPNKTLAVIYRAAPAGAGVFTWSEIVRTEAYAKSNTTYDHVCNGIVISPDNTQIYFTCGSRTDHGEVQDAGGAFPNLREEPLTRRMFRVPSNARGLVLRNDDAFLRQNGYLFADGLRNTYDMAFNAAGDLIGPDNGPDGDYPDELNAFRQPQFLPPNSLQHYGFPWVMGNLVNKQTRPDYNPNVDKLLPPAILQKGFWRNDPTFPPAPALEQITPLTNLGPDADQIRRDDGSIIDASVTGSFASSFTPHRSMLGISFDTRNELPGIFKGDMVLASYGSVTGLLPDVGRDLLHLEIERIPVTNGEYRILNARTLASGFFGPVDTVIVGGRIYLLDYGSDLGSGAIYEIGLPTVDPETQITTVRGDIWVDQNLNGRKDAGEPVAPCGSFDLVDTAGATLIGSGQVACGSFSATFRTAQASVVFKIVQANGGCTIASSDPNDGVDNDNNARWCTVRSLLPSSDFEIVLQTPPITAKGGQTITTVDIAIVPNLAATATPRPPTATPIAPTATNAPATATPIAPTATPPQSGELYRARIWNDANGDRLQQFDEPRLQGWRFTVFDLNRGDAVLGSALSDVYGFALIRVPFAATVRLCVEPQAGWTAVVPREFDSSGRPCHWRTITEDRISDLEFGFRAAATPPTSTPLPPTNTPAPSTATPAPGGATFVAEVWNDANENRSRDASEAALSGWRVTAFNSNNAVAATGLSDANGVVRLGGLVSGSYRICEDVQRGWRATQPIVADDAGRPCYWFSILNGQTQTIGFGNKRIGASPTVTPQPSPTRPAPGGASVKINIAVFNDANGNGAQDGGEGAPSAGFNFIVLNASTDAGLAWASSGANSGSTSFGLVPPGNYKVCQQQQAGWRNTRPQVFDSAGRACYWFSLPANTQITLTFGNVQDSHAAALTVPLEAAQMMVEPLNLDDGVVTRPMVFLPLLGRQ